MREIKFRAWDKKGKYMFETMVIFNPDHNPQMGVCQIVSNGVPEVRFVNINDFELMQFTGLKDKNGKEIYEGDIIDLNFETVHLRGKVIQEESGDWLLYQDEQNFVGVHHNKNRIEIIGNIYENPELPNK